MSFDEEIESLEREAYQQLKTVPRSEFRREAVWRSAKSKSTHGDGSAAIEAVLDFKEHRRSDALSWAGDFVTRFLSEIRAQICADSTRELGKLAGVTPKTAASAVAAWIVASFGVTNPIAFAMATLIVIVLARALRTAFCSLSDEEIKQTISSKA
jgi:hypothetical protein